MKQLFEASQFTPTQFDSAEDKAKFANHFVKFVESGFSIDKFPKWFYNTLSRTFGHIAHYDLSGFYSTFFTSIDGKIDFLEQTIKPWTGFAGDPAYTYVDVERALASWAIGRDILPGLRAQKAISAEKAERAELARLKAKYELDVEDVHAD